MKAYKTYEGAVKRARFENALRKSEGRKHVAYVASATGESWIIKRRLADDERVVAERKWRAPSLAKAEQKPCDHGLFSDEHKQGSLF
jgi:hypothetical protein